MLIGRRGQEFATPASLSRLTPDRPSPLIARPHDQKNQFTPTNRPPGGALMAEFPKMPFWTDAYLADTIHLTTIEHGAYLLLLITMWRCKEKRLPNDDKSLAKFSRLSPAQWAKIKPTIMGFFDAENGFITQGRLTDEAAAVKRHSKRQSDRVKARWLKTKDSGDTTVIPERYRNDTTLSPSLSTVERKNPPVGGPPQKTEHVNGKRPGRKLDPDWQPSADCIAYASGRGIHGPRLPDEIANFVDHFTNGNGRNKTRVSWDRTWQRWCREAKPDRGGNGQPKSDPFFAGVAAFGNRDHGQ